MIFSLEYITNYINRKMLKNENVITITFYDLKVEEGLSDEQIEYFLDKSKKRLVNLGYHIYEQGQTCMLQGEVYRIENNVYYVAIKE